MDKLNLSTSGFVVWIASIVLSGQFGNRLIDLENGFLEFAIQAFFTVIASFVGLFVAKAFFPKRERSDD